MMIWIQIIWLVSKIRQSNYRHEKLESSCCAALPNLPSSTAMNILTGAQGRSLNCKGTETFPQEILDPTPRMLKS